MRVGNLQKIEDIYKITVYEMTKEEYYTFLHQESAPVLIDSYLKYRKRYGEKITTILH